MVGLLGFDPLQIITQLIIVAAASAVLAFAWVNRARVLQALTGDDRIHGDCLDLVWFSCGQGCGLCTGEWTRCLTQWPCCPSRVRGANLVKTFGQFFGLTTYTVELKNIVVGDLPFDSPADFYLVVECAANPPMMSSLAEEKFPKVVHFPEVITCRLRWSHLEQSVRITVRELNVLGSRELCSCRIDAVHVLEWSNQAHERLKRFELKPTDHTLVRETPAWILVEFDQPHERRDLDHFHGQLSTVRTATRDGHYQDTSLERFKREYVLLDSNGHSVDEPPERDLRELARLRAVESWGFWICNACTLVLISCYWFSRSYVSSCHGGYWRLAVAGPSRMPISWRRLQRIIAECNLLEEGCKANSTEVDRLCDALPEGQVRPMAFTSFVRRQFGWHVGLPCLPGVCHWYDNMLRLDFYLILACIVTVLFNCVFHLCMRDIMRRRTRHKQHRRIEHRRRSLEDLHQHHGGLF